MTTNDAQARRDFLVWLTLAVEGTLLVGAIVTGWILNVRPLRRLSFDLYGVGWGVVGTLPLLAAYFLIERLGLLRRTREFLVGFLRPLLDCCARVDVIGIACLAGIAEEVFFRGLLQEMMAAALPWWAALAGASLIFGFLHAVTLAYFVAASLMGAALGGLYLWTGNLLAPIVAHALYDAVVLFHIAAGPEES